MDIDKILKEIDFEKIGGLIPVISQDHKTGDVLMIGFMNKESFKKTIKGKKAVYWSRTRKREWTKGETSGNNQIVKEIFIDCDNDSALMKVEQIGNVCHTGNRTCFFKKII